MIRRVSAVVLAAVLAAVLLGACGSGGGDQARTLLRQTFSGSHQVNSGKLSFSITLFPSGSRTLTGPLSLSFSGPFQSQGSRTIPRSDFTVTFSGLGKTGSISIISTGTSGYVTLNGTSYQLPAATFQRLESSFSKLSSPGGGSGGTLGKLGIDPLRWLTSPSVAGDETVGGAPTTHIRAGINVSALLDDLSAFLQKASSLGTSRIPQSISPATRQRIAQAVQNPIFNVWTGKNDKTLRRMAISLTLPVTGQISALLGGLRSAGIGLNMEYDDLNQPQTITAPTSVQPFSGFQTKLRTLFQTLQGSIGGAGGSSGSTSGASSTSIQRYTQCIQAAAGNVSKMQQCAQYLNGG